jgi:hypothetical protein
MAQKLSYIFKSKFHIPSKKMIKTRLKQIYFQVVIMLFSYNEERKQKHLC